MEDQAFKLGVGIVLFIFILTALYCWNIFKILQQVPRDKHQFPSWFVWLFLIPWVGFVFQFIMLPFGIPNTFKRAFPNNQDAIADADTLFKVGLAQIILTLFGMFLPIVHLAQICAVLGFVLWIAYWYLINKYKSSYISNPV